MQIDIIGDIHGHADALEALLRKLGFSMQAGAWRHPGGRRAIFVGDLIDRGPRQRDTVSIVRAMVEAGSALAVMGNHEFNAIGYATPDPDRPGTHLRERSDRHRAQHAAFLDAVGGADTPLHDELVAWFRTLPLWLDLDNARIVHACWSPAAIEALAPDVDAGNRLSDAGLISALTEGTTAFAACDTLLKGPEMALPDGITYRDAQGHVRRRARIRWWDAQATTYCLACVELSITDALSDDPLPIETLIRLDDAKPVFFGHYWMTGRPHLLGPIRACLDFSVAKGGVLCAYRFDGESPLDPTKLVWV